MVDQKTLPFVNIIIVTYNEFHYTEKCIETLFRDGYPNKKIILVDNASEYSSYNVFVQKYHGLSNVVCIRSEKNLGFGGGCNLGLESVSSGYVVFLNNDTEVVPGWLESVVMYMEENQSVGACQPKIKNLQNKEYFEYAGAAGGFMDVYGYPFTRGRVFYTLEKDTGQYDDVVKLVWCSGTAMITKKSVLDKVGLFDDIFFMYGEEADLCWRIHRAGWDLVFIPESVVYHHGMGTMKKNKSSWKTFLLHRNGLILLFKNYSFFELLKYFPVRMLLDCITFWYYLVIYPPNAISIIRSYGSFFLLIPQVVKSRYSDAKKIGNVYNNRTYPLYKRSVVVDYFLLKKKKFSEILQTFCC